MNNVQLSLFDGSSFNKGAGFIKQTLWYFVNALFVRPPIIPFMGIKVVLLRLFGAKIGKRIYLKPCVLIQFPWNLVIGDDCWIGEKVWIDNLDKVYIGCNVCISQGALLLTGNHDYKCSAMPYRNAPIIIEDGVWIGAKTIVCSGVTAHTNSILTVGSVATKDLEMNTIYQGNPAIKIRKRVIKDT
ncbi:Galactoside O-acetyltransferase [termite gut metagenome]|uniref:Galactoside O-acetyltransferase n=1 Tax=termite gut metagenome TaxID=433724 RepID=A0A5J4S4J9_9ZZZZ